MSPRPRPTWIGRSPWVLRDRILDWMLHRAEDFREEGSARADSLRLLDRVIAARPDDWLTYALRGR